MYCGERIARFLCFKSSFLKDELFLLKNSKSSKPTVLIGKDTRASGDMLEAALTAGLCAVGCNVLSLGVIPTPAVAYLVGLYECEAGIMISASHNPCEYNGIKIFQKSGYKLDDRLEEEIESIILDKSEKIDLSTISSSLVNNILNVSSSFEKSGAAS